MVPPGVRLSFAHIAVAAAVGKTRLAVFRRPRVAILSTGDELVEAAQTPGDFQIRNSNSYSLAAQVIAAGGEALQLPIAADDHVVLRSLMLQGLESDLLLLSGGVSMGKFDLVEQVLADLGAQFFFTGALIQPGKPVVFGEASAAASAGVAAGIKIVRQEASRMTPFFGLPGNPVSTMVTFDLFVTPVLRALSGALPVRLPVAKARLAKAIRTKTGLTRFLPGRLQGAALDPEVEMISWQGSGDLMASAQADCYVIVPPDRDHIEAGETVSILLRTCGA
jgi:molybdopterin molybdotransferase